MLDAIDEGVAEPSPAGFLRLFERRLTAQLGLPPGQPLTEILGAHLTRTLTERGRTGLEERLSTTLGRSFLADRTVFSVLDLYRELGADAFTEGPLGPASCVLAPLLRPAGPDHVAFTHTAYQELLAARYLADPAHLGDTAHHANDIFLTEQVRAFLASLGAGGLVAARCDDCVLPAGAYLVGPAE